MDYYRTLGLTKACSKDEVTDAFRRLALANHPDKNVGSKEHESRYLQACEAYEVLSNARTRAIYDKYGERALKNGVPESDTELQGPPYSWSESRADQIFSTFFGTSNPFQALTDLGQKFSKMGVAAGPRPSSAEQAWPLECTLEEIYAGCKKTVRHRREVRKADGSVEERFVNLTIIVKPGTKTGTKFAFPKQGDEAPDSGPATAVYVLTEAKHPTLRRDGHDLVYDALIPLMQALSGTTVDVRTLDGRTLKCHVPEVIRPGHCKRIKKEGMPIPDIDSEASAGDLRVEFSILFPQHLSDTQKKLIKSGLYYPSKPSADQQAAVRTYLAAFTHDTHGWSTSFS